MVVSVEVNGGHSVEDIMSGNQNISINNNSSMVNNNNYPQVPFTAWNDSPNPSFSPGNVPAFPHVVSSQSEQGILPNNTPFSNFTFTSPTQVNSAQSLPVQSSSFPVSFSVPNQSPQNVIPGVGVSWQHALPSQSLSTNFGCCNKFSGTERQKCLDSDGGKALSADHTFRFWPQPSCSSFRFEPQPSCSSQPRRPKRHYDYTAEGDIPSSKVYISEEKMSKRMQELFIADKKSTDFSCHGQCEGPTMELHRPYCTQNMKDRWKNFKELEKSLEDCVEGDSQKKNENSSDKKKRLKFSINKSISEEIFNQEPLLPRKIIDDMLKPNMEIVLWKPPGDIVKDAVQSVIEEATNDNRINHQIDKSLTTDISLLPQPSANNVSSQSCFTSKERNITSSENHDVDMFDGLDDDMDL